MNRPRPDEDRRFHLIFRSSPVGIGISRMADGRFIDVNDSFLEIHGYRREEVIGHTSVELGIWADLEERARLYRTVREQGRVQRFEMEFRRKSGETGYLMVCAELIEFGDEQCLMGMLTDITERKTAERERRRAQEALRESEELLRIFIDHAPAAIAMFDREMRYLYASRRWRSDFGIAPEVELRGRSHYEEFPDLPEEWKEAHRRGLAGEVLRADADRFPHPDGSLRWIRWELRPWFDSCGEIGGIVIASEDITSRKVAEEALKESEDRYRSLVELSPQAIFIYSDGRFLFANEAGGRLLGADAPEQLYGREVLEFIHPDFREQARRRVFDEEVNPAAEQLLVRLDGSTVPVEVASAPLLYCGRKSVQAVVHDISERKMRQEELIKNQKLESLGLLAGGIAHDFNNILTGIMGNVSLARLFLGQPEKLEQRLEDAEKAATRAKDLTRQLLTFSKGGEPVKKVVALGAMLEEAASFALHGSSSSCSFHVAPDLWLVEADEGQIGQVIHNLVLNAIQAMPTGGLILLGAANAVQDDRRWVRISVADTGVGIQEKDLPRIFDPYFTTKTQGSGIGLATSHSIVTRHGGRIWVASVPGEGSTFFVDLPALEEGRVEAGQESRADYATQSDRALVMDDEETVRMVAQTMLEQLGYQVECVENGSQAIELYQARMREGIPFSVVIMDLTVPGGMGGKEAVGLLKQVDPAVRVIVSSGYSNDPVLGNYEEFGFCAILAKPYRIRELETALQRCHQGNCRL